MSQASIELLVRYGAVTIGIMMIAFVGVRTMMIGNTTPRSPFRRYLIQIFAMTIIVPAVLIIALLFEDFPVEAITGLLGTIVGFFFGGAFASGQQE